MCASALLTKNHFGLNARDKALLCLSADYIAGKMMIVRAFVIGLDLRLIAPAAEPLKNSSLPKIKFAAMVPLQLETSLMKADFSTRSRYQRAFSKIDILIVGGSPMRPALYEALSQLKCCVYFTYGMTETLSNIAVKRIDQEYRQRRFEVLPGIGIAKDERDCMVVDAPSLGVARLHTNDIIDIDEHGHFEVLGRIDHVINTGSVKIIPECVEKKIASLLAERRFFVFARSDDRLHQKVSLLIEGEPFTGEEERALSAAIKVRVRPYECPKSIEFLPEFTETLSGKPNRLATIERVTGGRNSLGQVQERPSEKR